MVVCQKISRKLHIFKKNYGHFIWRKFLMFWILLIQKVQRHMIYCAEVHLLNIYFKTGRGDKSIIEI